MQRNKYLDDLGLRQEDYGVNFTRKDDDRLPSWEQGAGTGTLWLR